MDQPDDLNRTSPLPQMQRGARKIQDSKSEPQLDALFQGIPQPVAIYRKTERGLVFTHFNRALDEISRGQIVHVLNKTIEEIYADQRVLADQAYRVLESRQNVSFETDYRPIGRDELRRVVFTLVYVPPDRVMMHALDITERVRAVQTLRQVNQALEQRVVERTDELERANRDLTREIERRKRIEDELREAEQKANDLIRYAPTAIYEIDFRGPRFTRVNDAMCEMSGYAREELLAMSPFDLLDEDSRRRFQARVRSTFSGEKVEESVEYGVKVKDGRELSATLKTSLLYEAGKPVGAFVIAHDMTERKRAEEALHETLRQLRVSEERFRTTLKHAPIIVYTQDLNLNYTWAFNPWGLNSNDLEGQVARQIVPRYALELKTIQERVIQSGNGSRQEITAVGLDGHTHRYDLTVDPLHDDAGKIIGVTCAAIDITEYRQATERIQQLNRELNQRAIEREIANQELESFSFSVSHDLRAPLATVDGVSRMLQDEYGAGLPSEGQHYLELIRAGTRQMDELIQSLLGLSRLTRQVIQKQTVNMTSLVMQALETLHQEPPRQDLTLDIRPLADAEADPVLLKQVWINLIANALKFTRRSPKARIEIGCTSADDAARVYYVRDNGVGFDMQQADRLFGVFQRLHSEEEYEGTGVGLAIVQRVVHRHGGRVWAHGAVGEGASFFFTLE